jgi:hypothetical protein
MAFPFRFAGSTTRCSILHAGTYKTAEHDPDRLQGMNAMIPALRAAMMVLGCLTAQPSAACSRLATEPWPGGRAGHAMAYDAIRHETLLLGGDTDQPNQTRDTLWAWSGSDWHARAAEGPGWRTLPAMAFDSRRGRTVLFSGTRKITARQYAEAAEGDTWEWDGTRWELRQVNSPGRIDHHAMTYDEARGVVVMQGGGGNGTILSGETWEYDGAGWTRVAEGNAGPGERVHHAMAYDKRRQRVVLYGGFGMRGEQPPDVWEWDGRRWDRISAAGPGPRSRHRLAYDDARGVVVLYGGSDDRSTWTWDGLRWRSIPSADGPPATDMQAMAYDARRERVVMYGGRMGPQLWQWDGTRWEQVRSR